MQSDEQLLIKRLGLLESSLSRDDHSKILKLRSKTYRESNGQMNQTLVLVRESGRIELYMNTMLIEQYFEPENPCINVWAIHDGYILKFKSGDKISYK